MLPASRCCRVLSGEPGVEAQPPGCLGSTQAARCSFQILVLNIRNQLIIHLLRTGKRCLTFFQEGIIVTINTRLKIFSLGSAETMPQSRIRCYRRNTRFSACLILSFAVVLNFFVINLPIAEQPQGKERGPSATAPSKALDGHDQRWDRVVCGHAKRSGAGAHGS